MYFSAVIKLIKINLILLVINTLTGCYYDPDTNSINELTRNNYFTEKIAWQDFKQSKNMFALKESAAGINALEKLLLSYPNSQAAKEAVLILIDQYKQKGDMLRAKKIANFYSAKNAPVSRKTANISKERESIIKLKNMEKNYIGAKNDKEKRIALKKLTNIIDKNLKTDDLKIISDSENLTISKEISLFKAVKLSNCKKDYANANMLVAEYLKKYKNGLFSKEAMALETSLSRKSKTHNRTIGIILPLNGAYSQYGHRVLSAISLALKIKPIKQFNAPLFVKRAGRLVVVIGDSAGNPKTASKLVDIMAEQYNAIAIIGDILNDTSLAVAIRAEQKRIPIISISRRSNLTNTGSYVFRVGLTLKKQAYELVKNIKKHNTFTRYAIMYPKHAYGIEMASHLIKKINKTDGEVVSVQGYNQNETTFTEYIKKITGKSRIETREEYLRCMKNAEEGANESSIVKRCVASTPPIINFDVLFIPDFPQTISYIVPALVAENVLVSQNKKMKNIYKRSLSVERATPVQLAGGNSWHSKRIGEKLGSQVDGSLFVDGISFSESPAKEFFNQYKEATKQHPTLVEAQAFDATNILLHILSQPKEKKPKNKMEMRDKLYSIKNFQGITGKISFDKKGESVTPLHWFTFSNGKLLSKNMKTQE